MQLVTLDIGEVAEVIDEAVTRNAVIVGNKQKAIANDIIKINDQLQKLDGDKEGIDKKVQFLEDALSTLRESISKILLQDEASGTYFTIKQAKSLIDEIHTLKSNLDDRFTAIDVKNIEINSYIESTVLQEIGKIPLPKDGKDGAPGIDGKDGKDGKDGTSISIDDVKPIIEETTKQIVSTIPLPKDGIGIAGAMIDRNGELFVTCTNGNTISLGPVVGRDGRDGASVALDDIKPFIEGLFANIPAPKDGKDGTNVSIDDIIPIIEKAVAGIPIPTPKDGTSITIEDIRPVLEELVKQIPPPKDGLDGLQGLPGKSVSIEDVKPFLQELVDQLPVPKDGTSVTIDDVKPLIEEAVSKIPPPRDDTSVTIDDVRLLIEESVKQLPSPKDGSQGLPGKDGLDGVSVSIEDVRPVLEELVSKIPLPKDGISISLDDIKPFIEETISRIPPAKDGKDGKDAIINAAEIELLISKHVQPIFERQYSEIETISSPSIEDIPDEIAEQVAKAISIVAESTVIQYQQQQQPVIVNVTHSAVVPSKDDSVIKRVTAHRNPDGSLTADIVPVDKKITMRSDKDGMADIGGNRE